MQFKWELVAPWKVKEHKLFQLFLNACANTNTERFAYNNLTGGLFITTPHRTFFNGADRSRGALEVKVKYDYIIELNTQTFTATSRYKDLIKDEYGQENAHRKKSFAQKPRIRI